VLDTVVTDDGVECVLCVPRGRARQEARAASSVRGRAGFGAAPPASGSLLRAAAAGPLPPRATPPAACVCAAGVCAVKR